MGDRRAFVEMYEAYFGKWYASGKMGQEALWWDMVDKVPTSQFEKWFRNVLELWGMRQGSPKLRAFKIASQGVDIGMAREKLPYCGFCDNKGLFLVPAAYDNEKQIYIFNEFKAPLAIWAFPCMCKLGQRRYGRYMPPKEQWEKAFNLCKELRKICGINDFQPLISFEEFEKIYDPQKMKPYVATMIQLCRDSIKIHGVEDYPEHETINFDLTKLIQRLKRKFKNGKDQRERVFDQESNKSNGVASTTKKYEYYF